MDFAAVVTAALVRTWCPAPSPAAPALNLETHTKLAREMFGSI